MLVIDNVAIVIEREEWDSLTEEQKSKIRSMAFKLYGEKIKGDEDGEEDDEE